VYPEPVIDSQKPRQQQSAQEQEPLTVKNALDALFAGARDFKQKEQEEKARLKKIEAE
jgi:hypothetical protein